MRQFLSGKRGASFDKNLVPSSPTASGQAETLLTIDTACQGLRRTAGTGGSFADGGRVALFHMIGSYIAVTATRQRTMG